MDIDDLQGINFPGPLVNFEIQEYTYLSIGNFIKYKEKFKDFIVIDEHIADIIMRCNSHGIKTYYCCAGHSLNLFYVTKRGDLYTPAYSPYISVERKPILKQMFMNSKYWFLKEGFVENGKYPVYRIQFKNVADFNTWTAAMAELRYMFSFLTNEFRQLPTIKNYG